MKRTVSWLKRCLLVLPAFLLGTLVYGQNISVTGTVTSSEDGLPIPGVSVVQKGTTNGTITDMDGLYNIQVPQGSTLIFSFVGMGSQEVLIPSAGTYDVSLTSETEGLEEVVVTALGIKRERKALGYAIQEVDGEAILESREANVANSLSGKVSGLQVIKSSAGPAGSSKIVLRGNSSLTGDNQPLIVVDGIPIDNFTGADNNDYWNPSPDMGNGLGDINPDDIESMSVLKGASAAALYGSRAGNGVILITTKSGKKTDGLGISVSATYGFETIFTNPELQSSFGQGSRGIFDELSTGSWGPKIEGQEVTKWDGTQAPLMAYDNVKNFFDTGITQDYNVSFQQQYDRTSVYTSFTHKDDKSMIPGAKLQRTNLLARATSKFGPDERWTLDTKVQYGSTTAKNRPLLGANASNAYYTMYSLPISLDIRDFDPPADESGNMIWYGGGSQVNPYWNARYNLNEDSRDRFILHGSLKYRFTDWLNAEIKGGSDRYTTNTETKLYDGSPLANGGRYSLGKRVFYENNFSALVTASQDNLFGKVGGSLMLGGNLMKQHNSGLSGSSGELEVPNLFSLNNGVDNPTISETFSERKINSVYGNVQLNYDGYLFLEGTFRNDWSSTLSKDNRSFFYPSVTASYVITDMLNKSGAMVPTWLTFAKVRASYAEVGNDLQPYQLYNTYWIGKDPSGDTTAGAGTTLFDSTVRSELIKSYEIGAELRLFQNRLGIDFAWYKSNATRQLIDLPMDPMSGYERKKINAGDIQNKGVELMLHGDLLRSSTGLNWDMQINYSKNENTIEELAEGVERYKLGGYDNVLIDATVGGMYGEIYGTSFLRVTDEESEHYGRLLLDGNGLPQEDGEVKKLGNQQPDAMVGWINNFSYKNLSLSFQVDGRFGGEIFSGTNLGLQRAGTADVTAPGGMREDMVVDGVVMDGDNYIENTTSISTQDYWNAVTGPGNLGITEANIYDATSVRLRNIRLSYNLRGGILENTPIKRMKLGFTVNNVWLIKSHLKGVDPESVYATGTNAVGFENAAPPTSRTYIFNLSLDF
ncbi:MULTISPECIES: SusC/RagA family TonB-linked outer membrane protein [unclassified Carboxylicivirga]|uniref:SusC/RagA family TonB-linked outer membrane protein n=1 Tax=Carboxylicivirga TaxID=1628153 RepID=UPI003D333DF9